MLKKQYAFYVTASIGSLLAMSQAQAQVQGLASGNEASSAEANSAPADTTGDIIVTAQKRSENAQRIAVAVSVASGAQLVQSGISNVTGLAAVSPSVKLTSIRQQTQVYVRGIGSSLTSSNADPAVAINVNGAYVPSEMSGAALFDVERVEVLPGPQGTLYGRNAAGGAINIISRRPGSELAGEAYIEGGNYDTLNLFAAIDLPVSDILSFRVAGLSQRHDGYIRGANGSRMWEQDSRNLRVSALLEPSDRTSIFAALSYSKDGGIPNIVQNNPPVNGAYSIAVDADALGLATDYKTWIGSLELNQKLSDTIALTYIGGYSKLSGSQRNLVFLAGPSLSDNVQRTRSITNEIRLSGEMTALNWVVGAYAYDSKVAGTSRATLPPLGSIQSNGPFEQDASGYAAFGQLTYTLASGLRATGGVRYSRDKKHLVGTNSTFTLAGVARSSLPYEGRSSDNNFDWKVGAEYDLAAQSMLYASIQTGYNQGGFSTAPATVGSIQAAPYEAADVLAYTVGVKNRFFDRALTLNLEGFYYDYSNYQVSARNLQTAQNQIYNAKKAETYGIQADTTLKVSNGGKLDVNLALLHAEAKELRIPPATNLDGFTLPYSPKLTLNVSYTHVWELANGGSIEGTGSYRHVSGVWATYFHGLGTYQPKYDKADFSLTYYAAKKRWSVSAFARNVGDKAVFAIINANALPGPGSGFLEPPRTYGVRVGANF